MHTKVTTNLESTNAIYKVVLDQHHHHKVFEVGDLFMVHLQKPRFLVDTYHKLQLKQIDPYKFLDHFHIHIIDLTPYFPLDQLPMQIENTRPSSFPSRGDDVRDMQG